MKVSARTAEATHVESLRKSPKCKKRCRRHHPTHGGCIQVCAPVLFCSAQVHFALTCIFSRADTLSLFLGSSSLSNISPAFFATEAAYYSFIKTLSTLPREIMSNKMSAEIQQENYSMESCIISSSFTVISPEQIKATESREEYPLSVAGSIILLLCRTSRFLLLPPTTTQRLL